MKINLAEMKFNLAQMKINLAQIKFNLAEMKINLAKMKFKLTLMKLYPVSCYFHILAYSNFKKFSFLNSYNIHVYSFTI